MKKIYDEGVGDRKVKETRIQCLMADTISL